MTSEQDYERALSEAWSIDPRHQEYPCWCLSCGGRWSIYRPPESSYARLHDAGAALHRELSPECTTYLVRVGSAVPYGEAAPEELIEHADSPFV